MRTQVVRDRTTKLPIGRQPTLPSLLATNVREICLCFVCVKVKKCWWIYWIIGFWNYHLIVSCLARNYQMTYQRCVFSFGLKSNICQTDLLLFIYLFSKQPAHQWFPLYSSQWYSSQWSTCFTQHPLFQAMCSQLSGAISIRKSPQLNWLTEIQTDESGNPFTQWQ